MSSYADLLGLPYIEGKQDCFSILRTYYRREWGLEIPNFARPTRFWEDPQMDLYQLYKLAGFQQVFDELPRIGDGLLMPLMTPMATHGATLVEDNKILHHLPGRLSSLDTFRPRWSNQVTIIVRHPEITAVQTRKKKKPVHLHEVAQSDVLRDPKIQGKIEQLMEAGD